MLNHGSGRYSLVMPRYIDGQRNQYTLSAVAWDKRNNVSKTASTLIAVTAPTLNVEKSVVTASPEIIPADGRATSTLTIKLSNEAGDPVTGLAGDINLSLKEESVTPQTATSNSRGLSDKRAASISSVSEKGDGIYLATLTAGTRPLRINLSSSVLGQSLNSVEVMQISDAASASVRKGDLILLSGTTVANGAAAHQVQAKVTDSNGNPVSNILVTFSLSGSAQPVSNQSLNVVSDADGLVTLLFTNTVAEEVTITAGTAQGSSASCKAAFTADTASGQLTEGNVTADRKSALANGNDPIIFRALVLDANGNPMPGMNVNWIANGGKLSGSSSNTDVKGIAVITLMSTKAQSIQVGASLSDGIVTEAPLVNFVADSDNPDPASSSLTASPASIVADGAASAAVTLTLRDRNGNPVSGQAVAFASSLAGSAVTAATDNGDGSYSAALSGTGAGTASVTATVRGAAFGVAPASVTLTADAGNLSPGNSALTASPASIVADGAASAAVTLTLRDRNGNPVSGQAVAFASSLAGSAVTAATDNGDGSYSAALSGTGAGAASVTLTADADNLSPGNSALTASPASIVADGAVSAAVTLTLRDRNGNPVSGQAVAFASSLDYSGFSNTVDNGNGTYTADLSGTLAGSAMITISVNGNSFAVSSATVTFNYPRADIITGSNAVTPASNISRVLDTSRQVEVAVYDGYHSPKIIFPSAAGYSGKLIRINHTAIYSTTYVINGTEYVFGNGAPRVVAVNKNWPQL